MARQPSKQYLKLKERYGALIDAVETMGRAVRASGPLDEKSVCLIQLGAAAVIHSEGSVHSHTVRALEAGATPEEIHHAIIVLASTIGFPTVSAALSWVDDVIENLDIVQHGRMRE